MSALEISATVAARGLDVEFAVPAGSVLALLGANGAGKSTALHVAAGLVRPDSGRVLLGDRVLTDTSAGIDVPTHDRRVGLLLQDPLLFPHLDVVGNVAFAARIRGRGRAARGDALHWLREVDAAELAGHRPRDLSGGQAQRVAIARALAGEPGVMLLDEPMAGLDIEVADHVVVLQDGRVAESGRTAAVLSAPRSAFGARLAGLNLITGSIESDDVLRTATGEHWHGVSAEWLAPGRSAVAVFAPAAVGVFADLPRGSPRNVVEVQIAELESRGAAIRVRSAAADARTPGIAADVTPDAAAELWLTAGTRVWFAVKAQEVALYGL